MRHRLSLTASERRRRHNLHEENHPRDYSIMDMGEGMGNEKCRKGDNVDGIHGEREALRSVSH